MRYRPITARVLALGCIVTWGACGRRPFEYMNGHDAAPGDAGGAGTANAAGTTGATGATNNPGTGGRTGVAGTGEDSTGGGGSAGGASAGETTGAAGAEAAGAGGRGATDGQRGAPRTMAVLGCSMTINVQTGYARLGGMRMWPPAPQYQSWVVCPDCNLGPWEAFAANAKTYGPPTDVWIMICAVGSQRPTAADVRQTIADTRSHAPGANIYITGQLLYSAGHTCSLSGEVGPDLTDQFAREAVSDASLNVIYAGTFILDASADPREISDDTCHASAAGELSLGNQAVGKWGK